MTATLKREQKWDQWIAEKAEVMSQALTTTREALEESLPVEPTRDFNKLAAYHQHIQTTAKLEVMQRYLPKELC